MNNPPETITYHFIPGLHLGPSSILQIPPRVHNKITVQIMDSTAKTTRYRLTCFLSFNDILNPAKIFISGMSKGQNKRVNNGISLGLGIGIINLIIS